MWDTVENHTSDTVRLSHDRPCPQCGHALHTYLACGDSCECEPVTVPAALAGRGLSR